MAPSTCAVVVKLKPCKADHDTAVQFADAGQVLPVSLLLAPAVSK